jgi:flagellar biosynthesis chaperone FliJ
MSGQLRVLLRLERHRLEEARRALADGAAGLRAVEERIARLARALPAEMAAGALLPPDVSVPAAYRARNLEEQVALAAALASLEEERAELAARVLARRAELRRIELLVERAEARAATLAERRAQKELDDLALVMRRR